jgi:hypothetical protein
MFQHCAPSPFSPAGPAAQILHRTAYSSLAYLQNIQPLRGWPDPRVWILQTSGSYGPGQKEGSRILRTQRSYGTSTGFNRVAGKVVAGFPTALRAP